MKLRLTVLLLMPLFFAGSFAFAADVGFVEGGIWFSKDTFFSGDTVRIYSGVFNSTQQDASGTVEFYDNDVKIGSASFSNVSKETLKEVYIDWLATEGNHVFSARILNSSKTSGKSSRFVDVDTDKDGIGNRDDDDDDNDGLLDEVDPEPLVPGAPNTTEGSTIGAGNEGMVAGVIETVAVKVDSVTADMAASLKVKQQELQVEIQGLQAIETATEQSQAGEAINQAVGDDNFVKPTRPTGTVTDTLKRIGKQILLFFVNAAIYVLEHKPLLYITIGAIGLFLLRLLWRLIGR